MGRPEIKKCLGDLEFKWQEDHVEPLIEISKSEEKESTQKGKMRN